MDQGQRIPAIVLGKAYAVGGNRISLAGLELMVAPASVVAPPHVMDTFLSEVQVAT